MTDHEDLIRRLQSEANDTKDILGFNSGLLTKAATAIKELVADYKGQGEALIKEVNAKLEAQRERDAALDDADRWFNACNAMACEKAKAEADLAAAREAIQWAWGMRDDLTKAAQAAIAAARAEGGG